MSAVSAKYVATIAPAAAVALTTHADTLVKVGAVVGGILLGMLWRAGSLRGEGRSWASVRNDLGVSALIGGANAVLAMAIVQAFDTSVIFAMAAGVVIGATGVRALPEIKAAIVNAARRKLIGDDAVLIQPKNPAIDALVERLQARADQVDSDV